MDEGVLFNERQGSKGRSNTTAKSDSSLDEDHGRPQKAQERVMSLASDLEAALDDAYAMTFSVNLEDNAFKSDAKDEQESGPTRIPALGSEKRRGSNLTEVEKSMHLRLASHPKHHLMSTHLENAQHVGRAVKVDQFMHELIEDVYQDQDEAETAHQVDVTSLQKCVHSTRFQSLTAFVIMLNAVLIAVESDFSDESSEDIFNLMDFMLTLAFAAEFVLRFIVDGWGLYVDKRTSRCDFGNAMDSMLVLADVIQMVMSLIFAETSALGFISALRMYRLVRLVRLIRLVRIFRGFYLFIFNVYCALEATCWGLVLLSLIMYICAVFLVRILAPMTDESSSKYDALLASRFGSMGLSVYSLFVVMTLDGWYGQIAQPAIQYRPYLVMFFVIFIFLCSYGIMLASINGVLVEQAVNNALHNSEADRKRKEKKMKQQVRLIHQIFQRADKDGSGMLNKKEFKQVLEDKEAVGWLETLQISLPDAKYLFKLLDCDGSGMLSCSEFVEGCLRARGPATAKSLLSLDCDMWRLRKEMEQHISSHFVLMEEYDTVLDDEMDWLENVIDGMHNALLAHPKALTHGIAPPTPAVSRNPAMPLEAPLYTIHESPRTQLDLSIETRLPSSNESPRTQLSPKDVAKAARGQSEEAEQHCLEELELDFSELDTYLEGADIVREVRKKGECIPLPPVASKFHL